MIDECTGVVLAGGSSSRMGTDKAMLSVFGEPLLLRTQKVLGTVFPEVMCVGRPCSGRPEGGVRTVADEHPGMGPLGGIEAALAAAATPWVFVAACDMPLLERGFMERLWRRGSGRAGAEAVVPRLEGRLHPLAGFYARTLLADVRDRVGRGALSVTRFLESRDVSVVEIVPGGEDALSLENVNTRDDWERVLGTRREGAETT